MRIKGFIRSKRKVIIVAMVILSVLSIGILTSIYLTLNQVKQTVNEEIHEKVESINQERTVKRTKTKESLNFLLLGVDERMWDKGRSDTIIVMTLDPQHDRMQMVSIPRDVRTKIIGHGTMDKINHAYAFGGNEMAVTTVEELLGIHLDYYMQLNMEGLEKLVDIVGGIEVNNQWAFSQGEFYFPVGQDTLRGEEALAYVRMRKEDPRGDVGRNDRQRQVVKGIIEKGASMDILTKFPSLLDVLGANMTTNMTFTDMKRLITNYRNVRGDVSTYQMTGTETRIDDIYYLLVGDEEINRVKEMIAQYGG